MEIRLESSWSIFIWNHEGIPFKINGNWSGELWVNFPMEYPRNSFQNQQKLMEICLESSWSISQWNPFGIPFKINGNWSGENPYGIPFKINGNWSGELLVNLPMESLRNSFQNQWKLVWRALRQFPYGILMEFLLKLMEIGLGSSWQIPQ